MFKSKGFKIVSLILLMALVISFYLFNATKVKQEKVVKIKTKPFPEGLVNRCRKLPNFISQLKMKAPSLDSRQAQNQSGLAIRDVSEKNKTWQHPSWKQTGYIGSFDRDEEGNIYVSPMPYVSLLNNPAEKQNRLYKIDKDTAEMSLFMELPAHNLPNTKNPFGAMAMAFDCDTQSMYVSSLAGSEPKSEYGAIYQIDLKTKKIISSFKNVDAIGINIINHKDNKTLYFGSARNPHMFSIKLDKDGKFSGNKQYELSLSELDTGDTTVIKKVSFQTVKNQYLMRLKEIEFGFRLFAENKPFKKIYVYQFDQNSEKWQFKGLTKE